MDEITEEKLSGTVQENVQETPVEEGSLGNFNRSLAEFRELADRPELYLDEEGMVTVEVGDDVLVNIAVDAESEMVVMFATVGAVDELEVDEKLCYERLLRAQAYWRHTRSFVIGLESGESGRLIIQDRLPASEMTGGNMLAAWIGSCATMVREIREMITENKEYPGATDANHGGGSVEENGQGADVLGDFIRL